MTFICIDSFSYSIHIPGLIHSLSLLYYLLFLPNYLIYFLFSLSIYLFDSFSMSSFFHLSFNCPKNSVSEPLYYLLCVNFKLFGGPIFLCLFWLAIVKWVLLLVLTFYFEFIFPNTSSFCFSTSFSLYNPYAYVLILLF